MSPAEDRAPDELPPEFDSYEASYEEEVSKAISFGGQGHDFYMQLKADLLLDIARQHLGRDPQELNFIDVGCGIGLVCGMLSGRVGERHGVDVSEGLIRTAERNVEGTTFKVYNGHQLPYPDDSFDVVYTICVVHHVPPGQWRGFLAELFRVTKPNGCVVVMEHNPLNPATRHVVNNCVFDKEAVLISAGRLCRLFRDLKATVLDKRYFLFFPFKAPFFRKLDKMLGRIPMGAQYYVAARKQAAPPA